MKTSPVTSLPAPLNLVANSPCMLALMSGFDHFHVDFFLMGDVAGHRQVQAEKTKTESSVLPEGPKISPLQPTDWAIFIDDRFPYADLKEWLLEHAGFTSSKQDNAFYLHFDCALDPAPVTVALIPFGELQKLDTHWWLPTGLGMATKRHAIEIESVLGNAPVCSTPNSPVWQPITLAEVLGLKLMSPEESNTDTLTVGNETFTVVSNTIYMSVLPSDGKASSGTSLHKNYKLLEQPLVFLYQSEKQIGDNAAGSVIELQKPRSHVRILGRDMCFTVHGKKTTYDLYDVVSCNKDLDEAPYSHFFVLHRAGPKDYSTPMRFNREKCRAEFSVWA